VVSVADRLRAELDTLLEEPVADAAERSRVAYDRQVERFDRRVVLFGAGNLGRKALATLRSEGVEPLAFVDNNPALWGNTVDGVMVMSPDEGSRSFGRSATFCLTIWRGEGTDTMAQRRQPLLDAGCVNVIDFGALFWKHADTLLPHYSLDLPQKVLAAAAAVRAGFELWSDDASRAEYVAQVRWRLWLDFDNLPPPVNQEIYFPADLMTMSEDEVFIDCGAYDGDTAANFIRHTGGHFKTIYAFEADQQNFEKLCAFVSGLPSHLSSRIRPVNAALSDHEGFLWFAQTGTAASAVSTSGAKASGVKVRSVALDDAVDEVPTWIKMDIEGSEPAALRGARRAISTYAPVLSICAYHSQCHVWSIPLQIRELHEGYRMYLRPFVPESWDLVCYAIPPGRSLP